MKTLTAMWLLLLCSLGAMAQTYLFTQPSQIGFPQWRCGDHAAHYAMYVVPPTGYLDLYGDRPTFWTENHKHCRWKITDGSRHAFMQFSFAKALETSYIDMWSDLKEILERDCLSHQYDYAPLVSNQLMILTVADDGKTWVGAYAGDLVTTLNDWFTPLLLHKHYIEVGLLQRTADKKIAQLLDYIVPGEFPQGATSRLEVYIYQQDGVWRAGGWYNDIHFDAPLIAKPAVLGKVGIIPVIMPRHLCTLNPASREFTFDWIEAQ